LAIGVPATVAAEGLYLAFSGSGISTVATFVAAYIFSAIIALLIAVLFLGRD
jgi:hypothetical protein